MSRIITGRGCSTCRHVHETKEAKRTLYHCRRYPPSVFPMFAPHPMTKQPVMVRQDSVFPLVEGGWTCGEHEQGVSVN